MPCSFATRLIVFLAALAVAASTTAQDHAVQRSFTGNSVYLDLSACQYRVTHSPDDRIRVTPLTKSDGRAEALSVRLDVNFLGTRADLKVSCPQERFEVQIELPRRVNLVATVAGGSVRLDGVDGDKDITAQTGVIEISVGDGQQYRRVTASVRRGDLAAPALGDKGSGGRSFEWTGTGVHDLRVRLDAGRLTLKN